MSDHGSQHTLQATEEERRTRKGMKLRENKWKKFFVFVFWHLVDRRFLTK
jgi:hypothetical protein